MMKPYKLSCVKQRPKLTVDRKQQKACRHQAPQKHLHQITSLNWRQRLFCLHQEYSSLLTSMQGNGGDRYSTLLMNSAVDGRKNFPLSLQERQKWTHTRKNLQVNDVVIIKDDDTPWNQWKVCHVIKALPDKDGLVSKVKLEVGSQYLPFNRKKIRHCQLWKDQSSSWCYYRRHKLTKDQGIPVKEPSWDKHIKT